jgi:hypothetical protein
MPMPKIPSVRRTPSHGIPKIGRNEPCPSKITWGLIRHWYPSSSALGGSALAQNRRALALVCS